MTWFAIGISSILTVLIAVIMLILPALSTPTIPLGVSVPQARVGDPSICRAIARFRLWVCVAVVLSLIVTVVLGLVSPVIATLIPTLLMIILAMAAYVEARRHIRRAKIAGDWYQDVPVRLTGQVTPPNVIRAPIPVGWYIAALGVLAAVAAIGVSRYDSLPNPIPTHWNAVGIAHAFEPKSLWSVFGVLLVAGGGMVVLLYLIGFAMRFTPTRAAGQDTPEQAATRGTHVQHFTQDVLGQLTLLIALLLAAITLFGWLVPEVTWFPAVITAVFLAAIAVVIIVYAVRFRRAAQPMKIGATEQVVALGHAGAAAPLSRAAAAAHPAHPDTPDDDHHWKAGIFYFNRDDPALMVPKRFGIGWTINLGRPAGMVILGLLFAVIIASIVTSVIAGGGSWHTS